MINSDIVEFKNKVNKFFENTLPPQKIIGENYLPDEVDCENLIESFPIGAKWDSISNAVIDKEAYSMSFFSDDAFRYYLPAFMIRAFDNTDVLEFCFYNLLNVKNNKNGPREMCLFFTNDQISCVGDFLKLVNIYYKLNDPNADSWYRNCCNGCN